MKTVQAAAQKQSAAAEISEKVAEATLPLIQMSGSAKKRKHHEIEEDEPDYHPDYKLPENDLHTPVPNVRSQKRNYWRGRGKKRGSSEFVDEREPKKRKADGDSVPKQQGKRWRNRRNKGNNRNNQQQSGVQNNSQIGNQQQAAKKQKKKRGNNQHQQQQQKHQQFRPFDYSSVDYNQFRGGGKNVAGTQNVKQSFKSKVSICIFI